MKLNIAVLPGDGIGPEVTRAAVRTVHAISERSGHQLSVSEYPIGGCALDQFNDPLPDRTLQACLESDAVLLGAVGGPRYDSNPRGLKPEDGLLRLREGLEVFANLRPVFAYDELAHASPLKPEIVRGSSLLIVRELLGGLYFGKPRGFDGEGGETRRGFNTMSYTAAEIERVARVGFKAAVQRRGKVTSVDKANVLETSQLWREVVSRVSRDYPDVELEHMLVDTCAMQLVSDPRRFDVILTENLFGDILSDEAAVIAGSIGMLASASIGGRVGLYEPVHGSAPDIAGTGRANPLGAIASAALMLRYSFGLEAEAQAVERAIHSTIARGMLPVDVAGRADALSTGDVSDAICRAIEK
jgi:3-isopropylmalate dehydrogenase